MPLIIDAKIKPSGNFAAVDAKDVDVNGKTLLNYIPIILTEEEYISIIHGGTIMIDGNEITYDDNQIYMVKKYVAEENI